MRKILFVLLLVPSLVFAQGYKLNENTSSELHLDILVSVNWHLYGPAYFKAFLNIEKLKVNQMYQCKLSFNESITINFIRLKNTYRIEVLDDFLKESMVRVMNIINPNSPEEREHNLFSDAKFGGLIGHFWLDMNITSMFESRFPRYYGLHDERIKDIRPVSCTMTDR